MSEQDHAEAASAHAPAPAVTPQPPPPPANVPAASSPPAGGIPVTDVNSALATNIIAVFIALAFGAKADALISTLNAGERIDGQHVALTAIFACTGLNFLLGTIRFMTSTCHSLGWWRIDLLATVLTLTILVALGMIAVPAFCAAFLFILGSLYLLQVAWNLTHPRVPGQAPLLRFWKAGNLIVGSVTLAFAPAGWLPSTSCMPWLVWLVVLHAAHLFLCAERVTRET